MFDIRINIDVEFIFIFLIIFIGMIFWIDISRMFFFDEIFFVMLIIHKWSGNIPIFIIIVKNNIVLIIFLFNEFESFVFER